MFPDDVPQPLAVKPANIPAKSNGRRATASMDAPPGLYDLTADIRSVVEKLVQIESLRHIDPDRLLIGVSVARARGNHGVMASCMPLRFESGSRQLHQKSGRVWEWPKIEIDGREVLYNLSFTVPRFLNNTLAFKLETVVHELFHISPKFDGTLRRLGNGRHAHHGPSRAYYDRLIRPIWTEAMRDLDLSQHHFLNRQADWLRRKFGGITGLRARRLSPRLIAGGSYGGVEAPPVDWEHGESE